MGHGATSPGIHIPDFKDLIAFVQNLESMLNDFPFLNIIEIKGSFRKDYEGYGRGLSRGRREKNNTKQNT
jgi:hypothetical protein